MKYDIIVWDFNGTLLCDMQAGIKSVNCMLSRRGLKTIDSLEEYRHIFCFPIIEYYRRVGFDLEREDYYTVLAPEWVNLYDRYSKDCTLSDGAEQILNNLKKMNVSQILLSATEINMLKQQTAKLGITGYFDEIYGLDNIHAHSKVSLAVKLKEKHPDKRMLMIGDTLHDAEVARAIDCDCVLYSGGHMAYDVMNDGTIPIVLNLSEIKQLI